MFSRSKWPFHSLCNSVSNPLWRQYATKSKDKRPTIKQLQISKSLSWLLRHDGPNQGLHIRSDGYARVKDVLQHSTLRNTDFAELENIVKNDNKGRFTLNYEPQGSESDCWWIRANQGHSFETNDLELKRIGSAKRIPVAVHGTSEKAWKSISTHGISRMSRNHIHLAQGFAGKDNDQVFSGIRKSSRVLIYINVQRALADGIKFYLSLNGVILSPGNDMGYLEPKYFERVERVAIQRRQSLQGWEAPTQEGSPSVSRSNQQDASEILAREL